MNHLLPAWVGEGLAVPNFSHPRWGITLGGWSLSGLWGEAASQAPMLNPLLEELPSPSLVGLEHI